MDSICSVVEINGRGGGEQLPWSCNIVAGGSMAISNNKSSSGFSDRKPNDGSDAWFPVDDYQLEEVVSSCVTDGTDGVSDENSGSLDTGLEKQECTRDYEPAWWKISRSEVSTLRKTQEFSTSRSTVSNLIDVYNALSRSSNSLIRNNNREHCLARVRSTKCFEVSKASCRNFWGKYPAEVR